MISVDVSALWKQKLPSSQNLLDTSKLTGIRVQAFQIPIASNPWIVNMGTSLAKVASKTSFEVISCLLPRLLPPTWFLQSSATDLLSLFS